MHGSIYKGLHGKQVQGWILQLPSYSSLIFCFNWLVGQRDGPPELSADLPCTVCTSLVPGWQTFCNVNDDNLFTIEVSRCANTYVPELDARLPLCPKSWGSSAVLAAKTLPTETEGQAITRRTGSSHTPPWYHTRGLVFVAVCTFLQLRWFIFDSDWLLLLST